jgi:hypothetical protein
VNDEDGDGGEEEEVDSEEGGQVEAGNDLEVSDESSEGEAEDNAAAQDLVGSSRDPFVARYQRPVH